MSSHLLEEEKVDARNERSILSSNCKVTSANSGSSINIANQLNKSVRSCCFRQLAACLCTTPAFACCSWTIFRYVDTNLARAGLPVKFFSLHGRWGPQIWSLLFALRWYPSAYIPLRSFFHILYWPSQCWMCFPLGVGTVWSGGEYVLLHSGISKCRSLLCQNHLRQAPWMF